MYRAMFDQHVKREQMSAVFMEYAWDMGWCDPCAADPLSTDELRRLGVYWVGQPGQRRRAAARARGGGRRTSSSRACTSATTRRTFPKTWCSRKPAIAPTSRAAT